MISVMKMMYSLFFLFSSIAAVAQNNRGLVFNKELKVLAGNWAGPRVYTDVAKNNSQVTLQTKLAVIDRADSLVLHFTYTQPDGKIIPDTSSIRIYDKEDKLSIDGQLYDIVSTGRKGNSMIVVGEKQGFDNRLVADLRKVLTFGQSNLNIVTEVRYMENEFYFIRNRITLRRE